MDFFQPDALLRGERIESGLGLLVGNGRILDVCAPGDAPDEAVRHDLDGLLAPGYVEIQINGCGGVVFTAEPTPACLRRMHEVLQAHGVTSFLPTLITAPPDAVAHGIETVRSMREALPSVLGLHLEGPHISLAKAGTHDPALIRPMSGRDLERLLDASDAVRLLTFAPEAVAPDQVEALAGSGITLALGHTAASVEEVLEAHRRGVRMLTHLYNAMPPLAGREPGPVGAAFASDTLAASIIVDGVHVHDAAILAAHRRMGERLVLTSDATASIEGGTEPFAFGGYRCRIEDGAVRNDRGALAGAAILLDEVVRRAAALTGDKAGAVRRASELPARLLGLGDEVGRLAPGLRADFNLLNPETLALRRVFAAGRPAAA